MKEVRDPARWSRQEDGTAAERAAGWSAATVQPVATVVRELDLRSETWKARSSRAVRSSAVRRSSSAALIAAPAVLEACATRGRRRRRHRPRRLGGRIGRGPVSGRLRGRAVGRCVGVGRGQWPEERVRRPVAGRRRTQGAAVHAQARSARPARAGGRWTPSRASTPAGRPTTASTSRWSGWTRTGRSSPARPRSGRSPTTA